MRLDRRFVNSVAAPVGKAEATYWDEASPGLGLRVLRSGAKSWIVRYRIGKRQKFTTIGRAEDLKVEKAREIASSFRAKAKLGQDPGAEVQTMRAAASDTLDRLIQDYIARHCAKRQKPRTQVETRRHLLTYWRPLHKTPVPAIDRRLVSQELHRIAREHGEVAANRGRSSLSALYTWAIKEGLAGANPVIGTNRVTEEQSRARVLDDGELRAIWAATNGTAAYARIVRLLMLTGLWRNEIGALAREEIDLRAEVIAIPGRRTKNGRPHVTPISPQVRAIVGAAASDGAALVFSGGTAGFSGWSRGKERLDERIARARRDEAVPDRQGKPLTGVERQRHALARWTLHDIRRTVATRLADLGIEPHVIEEVLGHASGHKAGVHGIYNRSGYEAQKRSALTLWGEKLVELVEGRTAAVVPLRAAQ
jgi:integrase